MRRRTRIVIVSAAALLIALPVGWYFGSPWWTLWRMRAAARAGDTATLSSYVDWEAVRSDATAHVHSVFDPLLSRIHPDTEAGRSRFAAIARRTIDESIDDALSPKTLKLWLAGLSLHGGGKAGDGDAVPFVTHKGLNVFEVRDAADSHLQPTAIFHRHGLGWKLTAVHWTGQ
jgi:hypothetical protein